MTTKATTKMKAKAIAILIAMVIITVATIVLIVAAVMWLYGKEICFENTAEIAQLVIMLIAGAIVAFSLLKAEAEGVAKAMLAINKIS